MLSFHNLLFSFYILFFTKIETLNNCQKAETLLYAYLEKPSLETASGFQWDPPNFPSGLTEPQEGK